jgi:hypothetical protein
MTTSQNLGVDTQYRPETYFWAQQRNVKLVSDIKGAERQKLYAHALKSGDLDTTELALFEPTLDSETRQQWGRIHPACLGGEFLPRNKPQEVEIARIVIASTTQDVTCVYARQVGQRIHYRVVDEYNGSTLSGKAVRTSVRPLTLEQLVDFFLESWDLIACLDCNFESDGYPRDEIHSFIVDASSSFYAEFDELIRVRVDDWLYKVMLSSRLTRLI